MDLQLFQGKDGGADGDRTHDLLTASQALSQLSYSPTEGFPYYKKISFQSRLPRIEIYIVLSFEYIHKRGQVLFFAFTHTNAIYTNALDWGLSRSFYK